MKPSADGSTRVHSRDPQKDGSPRVGTHGPARDGWLAIPTRRSCYVTFTSTGFGLAVSVFGR
jgi:hypothetical protein